MIWILYCILVRGTVLASLCPAGWVEDNLDWAKTQCHIYIPTPVTFTDAHFVCHSLGGELARPMDITATSALLVTLQTKVSPSLQEDIWVDIRLHSEQNDWRSHDGRDVLDPIPWKDTESEGECVIMGYSDAHMYKELCNNTAAFLCIGTKGNIPAVATCAEPDIPAEVELSSIYGPSTSGTMRYASCSHSPAQNIGSMLCNDEGTWIWQQGSAPSCKTTRPTAAKECHDLRLAKTVVEVTEKAYEDGPIRNFTCAYISGNKLQYKDPFSLRCVEGVWYNEAGVIFSDTEIKDCTSQDSIQEEGLINSALSSPLPMGGLVIIWSCLLSLW